MHNKLIDILHLDNTFKSNRARHKTMESSAWVDKLLKIKEEADQEKKTKKSEENGKHVQDNNN